MPYTTRFDPATGRGTLTADGAIDLGSSVEAMLALAGDPRLEPGWAILVDLHAASYTPTLADAAKLAGLQQHTEALRGRRIAFVCPLHSDHHRAARQHGRRQGHPGQGFHERSGCGAVVLGRRVTLPLSPALSRPLPPSPVQS